MSTSPTEEQIQALLQSPPEGSVRMLNLLKFKAQAEYEDGTNGGCGNGMVAIMQYPNIQAFLEMTSLPAYQQAAKHRDAGLAHQLLICCSGSDQKL